MVVSFGRAQSRHRWKSIPAESRASRADRSIAAYLHDVNAAGTAAAEWVHLGEIVVIRVVNAVAGIFVDRLPAAGGADISPQLLK
jgi:demethoxyubiquinone hydroxylase (CLK1/Coq7/Cat5 family)